MANTFKSYQANSVTTETTVYTSASQATVIGLTVANTGASVASASIKLNSTHIVKDAPIPVGGTLVAVGGDQKVVAENTDTIKVTSDVTVDVIVSVLEIT